MVRRVPLQSETQPMETFTDKAKRLERIRKALKRKYGEQERLPVTHPVEHAIRTVLAEETTPGEVDAAMDRIRDHFIDYNDLRVSRPREIRDVLGDDFPRASYKARVIPRLLDQVFKRHNSMVWDFLEEMGKIEAREFFEALEEVRPYVAATLARDCADAHTFPVDRDIGRVLGRLGLVDTDTDSETDMQGFMERAVKSDQAWELHALLRRLAEDVCVVDEPTCAACALKAMCPTGQEKTARPKRRKKAAAKKKAAGKTKKAAGKKKAAGAGKTKGRKKKTAGRTRSAKGKGGGRAKKKKTAKRKKKR
jgi:endonuclease-3